ncbi:MAG TPA: anti-CBASS Acb1 family protein [Candidatus Binatia bacterium]|nr:anti-CBASS Acb1 family protein [Candidatus Binatia bacterium]
MWEYFRTFGGERDYACVLGYKRDLTYVDYLARYARGGIAGPIVDVPARATWDTLPRLTDDELGTENALSKKFAKIAKDIDLRQNLEKVDRLAGIGRYAVLLLGFRDGKRLEEPVDEDGARDGGMLYVAPFSEANARPVEINLDSQSPEFGRPLLYEIDFARGALDMDPLIKATFLQRLTGTGGSNRMTQKVHASRIVHIAEGTLEDNLYGTPRLRRVWDRLDDLDKISGGSAEVFWLVANRGLQFDVSPEVAFGETEKEALREQIESYRHGLSREIRTRGVTIKGLNELGAGNVNPFAVFRVLAALITGTTGLPYRMIFGTERGQNTTSQDRRSWLEDVWSRRETYGNEVVLTPLVRRLVHAGVLPVKALDAQVIWPPVHDDMFQAEVADTYARADFNRSKAKSSPGGSSIGEGEWREKFLNLPREMPKGDSREDVSTPTPEPVAPASTSPGAPPGAPTAQEDQRAAA